MPNMDSIIANHNRNTLKKHEESTKSEDNEKRCNCKGGPTKCPLNGNCQVKSLVYKATVTNPNSTATYIGLTSNSFKERFNNHTASFNHSHLQDKTMLAKHIWSLKDQNKPYEIKWSIHAKAPAYSTTSKRCELCLTEKTNILFSQDRSPLNKRSEIMNTCRHRKKYLLSSIL